MLRTALSPARLESSALPIKRAAFKTNITNLFKDIGKANEKELSVANKLIRSYFEKITQYDELITEALLSENDYKVTPGITKEFDDQGNYAAELELKLLDIGNVNTSSAPSKPSIKLPKLICPVFSGEGSSHSQYYSFFMQFNNIIGSNNELSKSSKLTYLRTYLKGYALKLIQHLQISDSNYDEALSLLNSEFINKDRIISDLIAKLLNLKPDFDISYLKTKLYINDV